MNTYESLEEINVHLKLRIATLWMSFVLLYSYVDYFALYMPNKIAAILQGKVFVFNITQGFVLVALVAVTIPILMIFLSVALPTKVNRWTNIIIAAIYIPFTLFNLAGEVWIHMVFAAIVEVALLCLIIFYAWK